MKIQYANTEAFYNGIAELVQRGLTFEARELTLTITLTGGY